MIKKITKKEVYKMLYNEAELEKIKSGKESEAAVFDPDEEKMYVAVEKLIVAQQIVMNAFRVAYLDQSDEVVPVITFE